jgi:hypothetical protein
VSRPVYRLTAGHAVQLEEQRPVPGLLMQARQEDRACHHGRMRSMPKQHHRQGCTSICRLLALQRCICA